MTSSAPNDQNGNTSQQQTVAIAPSNGSKPAPSPSKMIRTDAFDQPVILQQTSLWSRGIVWGIVGVATFGIIWANLARIDEAVPAQGKLEPKESVQEIQAPTGGVVQEILVEDGERVQKGDVLIRFDPRTAQAQQESLQQIKDSLIQENRFYRAQLLGAGTSPAEAAELNLPPEMLALTVNRSTLLAENQLYQAQLGGQPTAGLTAEQQARFRVGLLEAETRAAAARLEVSQFQEQLGQAQVQLAAARENLDIDQGILNDIRPLADEGGIARLQLRRQEQEVLNSRTEVDRLTQEVQRLQFAISQAQERLQNTLALTSNDLMTKTSENDKRLAEIDSQLNKQIVENQKRISEIEGQLKQAEVNLEYQELVAPINGIVFDLQAKGPGFVANTSEPILKIVPNENMTAEVFITNQDIGFVREGLPVDVRIDSFPFSEFGDVKGTLVNIGDDALPPDEIHQFYRFPATVELNAQSINIKGKEVQLQSGMSVTANIKTRDRTVASIFTELFTNKVRSLETVR